MIPIAEMRYDHHENGHTVIPCGELVFVLGYVAQRERPMAIVMHKVKGWHTVELNMLIPKGWRTSGVP